MGTGSPLFGRWPFHALLVTCALLLVLAALPWLVGARDLALITLAAYILSVLCAAWLLPLTDARANRWVAGCIGVFTFGPCLVPALALAPMEWLFGKLPVADRLAVALGSVGLLAGICLRQTTQSWIAGGLAVAAAVSAVVLHMADARGVGALSAATCWHGGWALASALGAWSVTRNLPTEFQCISCGYDLRGIPADVCPECGTNNPLGR